MRRILIIDDDSQVRDMLEEMLSRVSYDVVAAGNGRTGLEELQENPADLVIIDMLMPGMDGLETIRHIRKDHPDVAVIALSGGGPFGRFDLLQEAESLGAVASLRKPVDWEELTIVVDRYFAQKSDAPAPDGT